MISYIEYLIENKIMVNINVSRRDKPYLATLKKTIETASRKVIPSIKLVSDGEFGIDYKGFGKSYKLSKDEYRIVHDRELQRNGKKISIPEAVLSIDRNCKKILDELFAVCKKAILSSELEIENVREKKSSREIGSYCFFDVVYNEEMGVEYNFCITGFTDSFFDWKIEEQDDCYIVTPYIHLEILKTGNIDRR